MYAACNKKGSSKFEGPPRAAYVTFSPPHILPQTVKNRHLLSGHRCHNVSQPTNFNGDIRSTNPSAIAISFAVYNNCMDIDAKRLYSGRGTVEFYVNVTWDSIGLFYPHNVTYSVLYFMDDSWGTVDGCCNLRPNATCMLRPRREGESFYTMLHTKVEEYPWKERCVEQIYEFSPFPWCEDDNSTQCLTIVNGSLAVENDNRVSFANFADVRQDLYFFRASRQHAGTGKMDGDLLERNVEGMEFDEATKQVKVYGEHAEIELKITNSESRLQTTVEEVLRTNATCEMWCFFFRVTGFAEEYSFQRKPMCATPWKSKNYNDTCVNLPEHESGWEPWQIALVAAASFAVLVVLAIIAACLRSRYKYCSPDPEEAKKYLPGETRGVIADVGEEEERLVPSENPDNVPVSIVVGFQSDTDKKESKDINMNDHLSNENTEKNLDEETSRNRMDSGLVEDANEQGSIASAGEDDSSGGGYILKQYTPGYIADSGIATVSSGLSGYMRAGSGETRYDTDDFNLSEAISMSGSDGNLILPTISVKQSPTGVETEVKSSEPHIVLSMPECMNTRSSPQRSSDEYIPGFLVDDGYLAKDNAPGVDALHRESLSSGDTGCDVDSIEGDAYGLKGVIAEVSSIPQYVQKEVISDESVPMIGAVESDSSFVGYLPK